MQRRMIRVDDYLKDKLNSFDLSIYECGRRICRKIQKGTVCLDPVMIGKLKHVITMDTSEIYSHITNDQIRTGLYRIFKDIKDIKPDIAPEDIPYKPLAENVINSMI